MTEPYLRRRRRAIMEALSNERPQPSFREMADRFGLCDGALAHDLYQLELAGLIVRRKYKARCIVPVVTFGIGRVRPRRADDPDGR